MTKTIMSGNEAVARGVWEAGCKVAAAYPGTPSTEILENIGSSYKTDIYSQWACNEKVAVEIAAGAAIGGVRAFAAAKHVGINVAADPIFTLGYSGVNAGLVIVSADDPGCHSSQNEQDNRWYAVHAKLGMLEPSDSQECLEFAKAAFELSERFDVPMLLRMTTRVCHSKGLVEQGERTEFIKKYQRDPAKYAMLPANARVRHVVREKLLAEMEEYACDCPQNRIEGAGHETGVITSGISYQHAREAFGDSVDYLKLGFTCPLPRKLIDEFAKTHAKLCVIEENDPYLETAVRALGYTDCVGKEAIPITGELDAGIVRRAFGLPVPKSYPADSSVPPRPPALCAGCPHRGFFYCVGRRKDIVSVSDIGCYTLGLALDGFDQVICMGAGFSSAIGIAKALEAQGDSRRVLGSLGDSTFFHSGITGLIDIVTSEANVIACVLDNSITAMTGHQQNPGTAINLMGEPSPAVDIETVVKATGIDAARVCVVDPLDMAAVNAALDAAMDVTGPFVIITKSPCALLKPVMAANAGRYCRVDTAKCVGCGACLKIKCPAISVADKKASISRENGCNGCGLCAAVCPVRAIAREG